MRASNGSELVRSDQADEGQHDALDDSVIVEGHKPLIPEGTYLARYIGHETAVMFARAQKVALKFEICEGAFAGTRLIRYFRVKQIAGRPGPNGRFKLSAGGDLYRTLARVLDVKTRPDRISLHALRFTLLKIHVRTVTNDRDNASLAPACQYSVVGLIQDGR